MDRRREWRATPLPLRVGLIVSNDPSHSSAVYADSTRREPRHDGQLWLCRPNMPWRQRVRVNECGGRDQSRGRKRGGAQQSATDRRDIARVSTLTHICSEHVVVHLCRCGRWTRLRCCGRRGVAAAGSCGRDCSSNHHRKVATAAPSAPSSTLCPLPRKVRA
jgi:hypothetical protein